VRFKFFIAGNTNLEPFEQSGSTKTEAYRKAVRFLKNWHLPLEGLTDEEISETAEMPTPQTQESQQLVPQPAN
jgi:hypothetical protein